MSEYMGECAICRAQVERGSCYEWADCGHLLCSACSVAHDSDELRELGFEVKE